MGYAPRQPVCTGIPDETDMPHTVFVLEIITKNDLEDTQHLKSRLLTQMKCWCKPGFHAKRLLKFVVVTPETMPQLRDRILPILEEMKDLGSIERFMISDAPKMVITDHYSEFDPFAHWLRAGHVEAAERDKPKRLANRERRQRWV